MKHDQPKNRGVENVLKRAKQMELLSWCPVQPMPRTVKYTVEKDYTKWPKGKWEAWRPVVGLPYSSTRFHEKFIGFNISFETFMTALENPKSVLYTKDLTGQGPRMSSFYGCVCSVFVGYCYHFKFRRICSRWHTYPDMIEKPQDVQQIELGDCLLSPEHIVLVTDIERDENEKITAIEITESVFPKIERTRFPADYFSKYWFPKYRPFSYKEIADVPYTPSPYVHLPGDPELPVPVANQTLLPDFGNKANYLLNEPVELNVMEEGWRFVVIREKGGEVIRRLTIDKPDVYSVNLKKPGRYEAFCENETGISEKVEFNIVDINAVCQADGNHLTVQFENSAISPAESATVCTMLPVYKTIQNFDLSEDKKDRYTFTVRDLPPGKYVAKIFARNEYGVFCSVSNEVEIQ